MTFVLTLDLIFTKANYGEGQSSFITQGHLVKVYSLNKKTRKSFRGLLKAVDSMRKSTVIVNLAFWPSTLIFSKSTK